MSRPTGKLESVEIGNFQAHRKTTLAIDPRITVIQGPNRVGKTAFLRATQSIIDFTPMKVRTRARKDGEECSVRLQFEDLVVSRYRRETPEGKLLDHRMVLEMDGEAHTFDDLRKCPEIIEEALSMGRTKVDKTPVSFNTACQQDPDFLLSSAFTGSVRLKVLGTVNDQHRFDIGLRLLKDDKKKTKTQLKAVLDERQERMDTLDSLRKERDLSLILEAVERHLSQAGEFSARIQERQALIDELRRKVSIRAKVAEVLAGLPDAASVTHVEDLLSTLSDARSRADRRRSYITRIRTAVANRKRYEAAGPPEDDLFQVETKVDRIVNRRTQIDRRQRRAEEWRKLARAGEECSTRESSIMAQLQETTAELDDLVAEGVICPFFAEVELQEPCRQVLRSEFEV